MGVLEAFLFFFQKNGPHIFGSPQRLTTSLKAVSSTENDPYIQSASRSPPGQFSTALVPFLSRLSLLGVTFGGLEMQLSGPKTDFGAQGAP